MTEKSAPVALPRVLVAEDEALIRLDLVELLTAEGYEVVAEAGDGEEALRLARELEPDLVVMDVKMPKMDGITAATAIAEDRIAPVVMLTAFSQRELIDRAAGATPVTEADRRAVLAAYVNANYLTTEKPVTAPAEAVVLVSGQPYVDKDSAKKDEAVLKVAEQFDQAGTIVVGGNGSAGGNLVAAVRSDPVLVQTISTVDNANTNQGQLVTALALVQQVTEKKAGQYGVADNATLLPRLPQ